MADLLRYYEEDFYFWGCSPCAFRAYDDAAMVWGYTKLKYDFEDNI